MTTALTDDAIKASLESARGWELDSAAYNEGAAIGADLIRTVRTVLADNGITDGALTVLTRELSCRLLADGWRK